VEKGSGFQPMRVAGTANLKEDLTEIPDFITGKNIVDGKSGKEYGRPIGQTR